MGRIIKKLRKAADYVAGERGIDSPITQEQERTSYFSEAITRRQFLGKSARMAAGAAGLAALGNLFYASPTEAGEIRMYLGTIGKDDASFEDPDWTNIHNIFRYEIGPLLQQRGCEVSGKEDNDAIAISGTVNKIPGKIRASLEYTKNDKYIGGGGYEVQLELFNMNSMMSGLADQIARDLHRIGSGTTKWSVDQIMSDGTRVQIR